MRKRRNKEEENKEEEEEEKEEEEEEGEIYTVCTSCLPKSAYQLYTQPTLLEKQRYRGDRYKLPNMAVLAEAYHSEHSQ